VKQVEHVARMGEVTFLAIFQPEKPEYGRDNNNNNNNNNNKQGYKNSIRRFGLDSSCTGLGQVIGRCEHDNGPSRYPRLRTS
jgi:hypothetical protein